MFDTTALAAVRERGHAAGRVGFVCSAWDLLHAGHCQFLQFARSRCDFLVAGLHVDPSVERPGKDRPVETLEERRIRLVSNRNVDAVIDYEDERDHRDIVVMLSPAVRFFGSDYLGRASFTGDDLDVPVEYHNRSLPWSSSTLRRRVAAAASPYSLWLVPADEHRPALQAVVDMLADRFGAPRFLPHATLYTGEWPASFPTLCDSMAGLRAMRLASRGIGWSDDYFTSFYVKLDAGRPFRPPAAAGPSWVGPHLSLLYGDLSSRVDRAALAREVIADLPPRIAFDSVAVVTPAGDWRNVAGWRVHDPVRLPGCDYP